MDLRRSMHAQPMGRFFPIMRFDDQLVECFPGSDALEHPVYWRQKHERDEAKALSLNQAIDEQVDKDQIANEGGHHADQQHQRWE